MPGADVFRLIFSHGLREEHAGASEGDSGPGGGTGPTDGCASGFAGTEIPHRRICRWIPPIAEGCAVPAGGGWRAGTARHAPLPHPGGVRLPSCPAVRSCSMMAAFACGWFPRVPGMRGLHRGGRRAAQRPQGRQPARRGGADDAPHAKGRERSGVRQDTWGGLGSALLRAASARRSSGAGTGGGFLQADGKGGKADRAGAHRRRSLGLPTA